MDGDTETRTLFSVDADGHIGGSLGAGEWPAEFEVLLGDDRCTIVIEVIGD